jgi:hypothetical protein
MFPILHVLRMRFIFSGATDFGNSNAQNRSKIRILIDLTKLTIGNLFTQEKNNIKLPCARQNMTLRNS